MNDLPVDGIFHKYVKMRPENLIVKVQASWDEGHCKIKAAVNVDYEGEHYYSDSADLIDGDHIFATPDELVVLRDAEPDKNVQLWNGRHICVGFVNENALILLPTVAP